MYTNVKPQKKRPKLSLLNSLLSPILEPMYQGSQVVLKQATENHPILLFIPMFFNMLNSKQENKTEKTSTIKDTIIVDVPKPIENFTGRTEELKNLHEILTGCGVAGITQSTKNLSLDENEEREGKITSINGLGGIGKTQLSLMYAKFYAKNYNYVIWLNAEDPSVSFDQLKNKIKDIDVGNETGSALAQKIYSALQKQQKKSLFIFDNAENCQAIKEFLPKQSSGDETYVLITSRWQNWENVIHKDNVINLNYFKYQETQNLIIKKNLNNVLNKEELTNFIIQKLEPALNKLKEELGENIEPMSFGNKIAKINAELAVIDDKSGKGLECLLKNQEEEGYESYIKLNLGLITSKQLEEILSEIKDRASNDDQIERLHEKLGGLPLALQQAVAYIKQQRNIDSKFGIEDYLKEYDKSYEKAEKLLDYNVHEKNNDPYLKTVMTTWKVTLDKIEKDGECGTEAIKILNVMAYLAPDNICNTMFQQLLNIDHNKVAGAISLLRNYSMINEGSKSDLSNIHRLVQEVIRINLKNKEEKDVLKGEKKVLEDAIDCLQHDDSSNLRSFVLVTMYASQYEELNDLVGKLSTKFCNHDIREDIKNFQLQSSATQEKDRFFEISKIILKCCFIYDDYKMIEFLIENMKSYFLLKMQSDEWKTTLLNDMKHYYISKKEMMCYLKKLGFEIKFDCIKNLTSTSSYLPLAEFFLEQEVLCKQEDLSELLKEAQSDLDIYKKLEDKENRKIQERVSKGLEVENEQNVKKKYISSQKEIKNLISLIENKQLTLRDSEQDETPNSDLEDLEEFTLNELEDAKFSHSPSSDMEVDSVQPSSGASKSWLPSFF